jgi:AcrR family transcriptional regulator
MSQQHPEQKAASLAAAGGTSSLASAGSRDARARRSNAALRSALLELLQEKPFDQISIRDICAKSRVHYATFFRHYTAKEELLDDIAKDLIADLNRITLEMRGTDDYQAGFTALCDYVDGKRDLWTTLLNGGAGSAMREEWLRQANRVVEGGHPVTGWLPNDLGAICASTLIAETLSWWLGPSGQKYGVQDMARIFLKMFTTPLIDLGEGT